MTPDKERLDGLRREVAAELELLAPRLDRLAADLHRHAEPGCRELDTVARIAGELEEEGFAVEAGVAGLATAFRAEKGNGAPRIAFLAEYDAIPGLGHAAGHNLLVAASLGAAAALARVARGPRGSVLVIGAPGEETIGGKIVLLRRGAFDDVDAALLAHPGAEDSVETSSLASWSLEVTFEGREAHAVIGPERGINALDAAIQLFVARDALLSSLAPGTRIPGVILEGGVRPNLVPARTRARFSLRATSAAYLHDVVRVRFDEIVEGVARATRTRFTIRPVDNLYDELFDNPVLAELYAANAARAGLAPRRGPGATVGSLDSGALSHRAPVLHPFFRVGDGSLATHTRAFAAASATPEAFAAARRAALALALTGLDLLVDPDALDRVRAAHAAARRPSYGAEAPLIDQAEDEAAP